MRGPTFIFRANLRPCSLKYPEWVDPDGAFARYPYLLPCLCNCLVATVALLASLCIPETAGPRAGAARAAGDWRGREYEVVPLTADVADSEAAPSAATSTRRGPQCHSALSYSGP